jgi:hypothetical protein
MFIFHSRTIHFISKVTLKTSALRLVTMFIYTYIYVCVCVCVCVRETGKMLWVNWFTALGISLLVSAVLLPSSATDLYQPGQSVGDYHIAITTNIGGVVVKALRHKPEGRGIDSR